MRYPKLRETPTSRELVSVFGGYNHNIRINEGEFYDMENLSSDDYPVLSPRKQRGSYKTEANASAMISKDTLCYTSGSNFVFLKTDAEGKTATDIVDMGLDKDTPKNLISMGAYVIVMPDKKYINTVPKASGDYEWGEIEAKYESEENYENPPVTYVLCDESGQAYTNIVLSNTEPSIESYVNPSLIPVWIDTSNTDPVLRIYSIQDGNWYEQAETYIQIRSTGIGKKFSVGDSVFFEGVMLANIDANKHLMTGSNTPTLIRQKGDNFIVVSGFCKGSTQSPGSTDQPSMITVASKMPTMDFVIESGNRLWGCRYGKALNGETVNEIYASKLGDFRNWYSFAGISTDSYAASVGTDGAFTGAVTFMGRPIFFKENCMHIVYGDYPANYQIQTTACRGVQDGCSKSLAIVNEVLYYKARTGICAYDGSLPIEVSSALGSIPYSKAVAGSVANKYYVSMYNGERYTIFVYDTQKGTWHKEDSTQVSQFCNHKGELYFINADKDGIPIDTILGTGLTFTDPIKWSATTGEIGTDSPDKKYISRMDVRMHVAVGARASFYIEYDSSGEWEHLYTTPDKKLGTFAFPIKPKRCDHLRIKIVGEGTVKIYSICKTIEQGSDI